MSMEEGARRQVLKMIQANTKRLEEQAAWANGNMRNRAFSTGSATAPTGVTNATALILGACKLVVRGSGIFRASYTLSLTGVTATDTIAISIGTQTAAGGIITLTNVAKVGPGFTFGTSVLPASIGAFVSAAVGGIVVGSGTGALVQYASGTQVAGTAATTFDFCWSNIIHNSISSTTAEVPFTLGNDIVTTFTITATHSATQVYAGFAMDLEELP